jgi:hypothetical protein
LKIEAEQLYNGSAFYALPIPSNVAKEVSDVADDHSDFLSCGEFDDSPFGIEDVDLLGDPQFRVGVARQAPLEFRKRVFAAAKSYTLGFSSVDYVYKRYSEYWGELSSDSWRPSALISIASSIKSHVRSALERVRAIPDKPDHPGLFTAGVALYRLQFTFRAAILTTHNAFHYESAALTRMILEQLAWIIRIHRVSDDAFYGIRPSACISELKTIYPLAGKLYGLLSKRAHIDPRTLGEYLSVEDGEIIAFKHYPFFLTEDAYLLLLVADVYVSTTEIVYEELLDSFLHTRRQNGFPRLPDPSRPIMSVINHYRHAFRRDIDWT